MTPGEILTVDSITNYFLYDQATAPADLNSDSFIRDFSDRGTVTADLVEFMSTGAGRFALGAKFEIIQRFFDMSEPLCGGSRFGLKQKTARVGMASRMRLLITITGKM